MPVIIDYSPRFREAEKVYNNFKTVYGLIKKSEFNNQSFGKITAKFVKGVVHEAFEIHPDIRENFPQLNGKLREMHNKGYLELSEDEISPFDSVTKEIYFNNLFNKIK